QIGNKARELFLQARKLPMQAARIPQRPDRQLSFRERSRTGDHLGHHRRKSGGSRAVEQANLRLELEEALFDAVELEPPRGRGACSFESLLRLRAWRLPDSRARCARPW